MGTEQINHDIKFDTLLGIVKESGSRIRSNIYINIILIGIAIACARNYNHPSWDFIHFRNSSEITLCISEIVNKQTFEVMKKNDKNRAESCFWFLSKRFAIPYDKLEEKIRDEKSPFRAFVIKAMTNELDNRTSREYFQIPLLGVSFHQNDTWLVTGFFLNVSFAMLFMFLKKDHENLRFMLSQTTCVRSQYAILSSHIFSAPHLNRIAYRTIYPLFLLSLYMMPSAIHAYVVIENLMPPSIGLIKFYLGKETAQIGPSLLFEFFLQIFSGIILFILGIGCVRSHIGIGRTLKIIRKKKFTSNTEQQSGASKNNSDPNSSTIVGWPALLLTSIFLATWTFRRRRSSRQ